MKYIHEVGKFLQNGSFLCRGGGHGEVVLLVEVVPVEGLDLLCGVEGHFFVFFLLCFGFGVAREGRGWLVGWGTVLVVAWV